MAGWLVPAPSEISGNGGWIDRRRPTGDSGAQSKPLRSNVPVVAATKSPARAGLFVERHQARSIAPRGAYSPSASATKAGVDSAPRWMPAL